MSEHYHDENDLKLMRDMRKLAPDDFNAWPGLNNIVGRDNGAILKIPRIDRDCGVVHDPVSLLLEAHAKAAQGAGATREEVVEASLIAAAFARRRRGHARHYGAQILR